MKFNCNHKINLISRIRFPRTPETSSLYLICTEGVFLNLSQEQTEVYFNKNGVLSLNTYFNSFYESFYAKYTELKSLYYLLSLEGDFQISLYREHYQKESRELIDTSRFEKCLLSEPIKLFLSNTWRSKDAGRAYLEINCLSNQGLFTKGFIATEQHKIQEVSLGIITCTFRKEYYIKKTVRTILKDEFLQNNNFKILIVDNGNTLKKDEFLDAKIQLIPNRNVGGSGGFTKGLIEALQEDVYTHFLFMDDDIELDSEAIYRLFSLYEYAKKDFAVAGSMLDLYKKHILYEAGAIYNKSIDDEGNIKQDKFKGYPLKHNLDLRNTNTLTSMLSEDNIDYGGFWFFAFSKEIVKKIGLLLPLFIKIDDMEFGLRINENFDNGIVAFPSIAVWHEPFYAKRPIWDSYYYIRNHLITNSIHSSLEYLKTVKLFTQSILYSLCIFDYNSAQMVIKAFEDYMQGPNFITSNYPEILHSNIFELSRSYKNQTILANSGLQSEVYQVTKAGFFQKMLTLLTLNGHLLPHFLITDESVVIRFGVQEKERDSICKALAKKRIIYVIDENPNSYQYEFDQKAGLHILFTWFNSAIKSCLRWSSVSTEWKKAFNDFTSMQFWQKYLEPQK